VQRWCLLLGMALVVGAPLLYLVGYALQSPDIGDCSDRWVGCQASAREVWTWDFQGATQLVVGVGCFVVTAALVAPWLARRPGWQRSLSVLFLVLGVALTGFFGLLYAAIYGAQCSDGAFLCFSGPDDAAALGSPGLVTGAVSLLLGLGLAFGASRGGRWLRVAGLSTVAGGSLGIVVALVAAGALDSLTG
jgi:hypothetical protein